MKSTVFAAEAVVCDEPDWNEAGLRLLAYMEEYADCPETLEMLADFQERSLDDLTGKMPDVKEEETWICEEFANEIQAVVDEFEFPVLITTTWLDSPLLGLNLVVPMSIRGDGTFFIFFPLLNTVALFDVAVNGTGQNRTATILGFNVASPHIPTSLTIPENAQVALHTGGASVSMPIVAIGNSAFRGNTTLRTVRTGERVTSIGESAFQNATNLETVTFDNPNLQTIGASAFENTRVSTLNIPSLVTSIGSRAFASNSSLNTVDFRSVTPPTFGASVFANTANFRRVNAPLGTLQTYSSRLSSAGANVNPLNLRFVGRCRSNFNNERCTCMSCNFRVGDVDGFDGVRLEDSQLIRRYLAGHASTLDRRTSSTFNRNSYNAALVTNASRRTGEIQRRGCDADAIIRFTLGFPMECNEASGCGGSCKW
jgi:hypothetical protein